MPARLAILPIITSPTTDADSACFLFNPNIPDITSSNPLIFFGFTFLAFPISSAIFVFSASVIPSVGVSSVTTCSGDFVI